MYYFTVPESIEDLSSTIPDKGSDCVSSGVCSSYAQHGYTAEYHKEEGTDRALRCIVTIRTDYSNLLLVDDSHPYSIVIPLCESKEAPLDDFLITAARESILSKFHTFDPAQVIPYTDIQVKGALIDHLSSTRFPVVFMNIVVSSEKSILLIPVEGCEWRPFGQIKDSISDAVLDTVIKNTFVVL